LRIVSITDAPSEASKVSPFIVTRTFESMLVPYCQVFCHEKEENMAILQLNPWPFRHSGTIPAGIQE
jgi:hypothetical protein